MKPADKAADFGGFDFISFFADPDLAPLVAELERISRTFRDSINGALLKCMADMLNKSGAAYPAPVIEYLARWIETDANIEALLKWLDTEGWAKVDGEEVEKGLVEAAIEKKNPYVSVVFFKEEASNHALIYSQRRGETPDVERIQLIDLARSFTPSLPIKLGLDALKCTLADFSWPTLDDLLRGPDGTPKPGRWLAPLAAAWMTDRAEKETERLDRDARAAPFAIRPKARTDAGNDWTPLPRALDGAAAMGGPFEMNGEKYAPEPDMAGAAVGRALRPRGLNLVPDDWLGNPAQMSLALDLNTPPEALREYMIETAARTAHLAQLPNMCPKLLGFMFAAAPMTGRPVKGTLLELAQWLYPDWKDRRQNKRDLKGLGAAFVALKGLRLVEEKPDGVRHPYDLFTVDYDLSCEPEAGLGFMLNPWLVDRMKGGKRGGYFLLNMTRWLALGIQNPRLFPLALRLAAMWDGARKGGVFDPGRLHPIEADRLAWECNTLPEGAAMYRAGKTDAGTGKAALAAARANLEADLDALREAGLLGAWKKDKVHGRGFTVLPVPPADYAEACKRALHGIRESRGKRTARKG